LKAIHNKDYSVVKTLNAVSHYLGHRFFILSRLFFKYLKG
jgi:hypothetical protein